MPLFFSRGGKGTYSTPAHFHRWDKLPYGIWRTGDGREILFSRFYEPLFERLPDGTIIDANPTEWVRGITYQGWFYNDVNSRHMITLAQKALKAWQSGEPMSIIDHACKKPAA